MKYIASCFWEGQEGSFLLWTTWHVILGWVLVGTAKKWEFGTLMLLAMVQVFLTSMLLGIYIGDLKIGSSPFILIYMCSSYKLGAQIYILFLCKPNIFLKMSHKSGFVNIINGIHNCYSNSFSFIFCLCL